jgi:alkanesulfonate monooxygenase SsuD/methylene tetrahydromethanopterin reductase-like flavin-dependent oxidoreductase (luciferase family)
VVRGPAALAKVLAGLDVMSGGRLIAGLGPGSSERDYASVGVPFEERWVRFDEAILAVRTLLRGESFTGRFSSVQGPLEPLPARPGGLPLWIGSWGSDHGLRRVARLGDGWVASAYNTTPQRFRQNWLRVQEHLDRGGRDAQRFGNGLATMWFHLDDHSASGVLEARLAPVLHRPVDQLRDRLAFGSAEVMVAKLSEFQDAGVQRLFIWPIAQEIEQLHRFSEEVMAQLGSAPPGI